MDTIRDLQVLLRRFANERDWDKYHTPQNLAAAIATEAGELLALYRWGQDATADRREDVCDEVADVFLSVLRFADIAGIDLVDAAHRKIELNARRYPLSERGHPDRDK